MLRALLILVALGLLPSCMYVNIRIPLDKDLNNTRLGSKVGHSSIESILGIVAWGDAGTQAAAEEGGITTITHADQEIYLILYGLYARRTTIVYGD